MKAFFGVREAGVAMVTVLFVGAALTSVATVAAFTTVKELRASTDDRKGAEAFAYAEAGIDRMLQYLRSGRTTWADMRYAGCTVGGVSYPPLVFPGGASGGQATVGSSGSFTVDLRVYNPFAAAAADKFPPGACVDAPPTNPRTAKPPPKGAPQYFAITSTGRAPAATRVVRQIVAIQAIGLPVGLFADGYDANGTPNLGPPPNTSVDGISMFSDGNISGRVKMAFAGMDPYYTLRDFWPSLPATPIPSAIHTLGTIYSSSNNLTGEEHSPGKPLNCTANPRGTAGQSQWDQSGRGDAISTTTPCAGQTAAPPPTSKFTQADLTRVAPKVANGARTALLEEEYLVLKQAAQQSGLYCFISTALVGTCTVNGAPSSINPLTSFTAIPAGMADNFVAYFEFQTPAVAAGVNEIKWNADYGRCADPPPANTPNQSMTLVVRRGDIQVASGGTMRGTFLVPEGTFKDRGSQTFIGSVLAQNIDMGGNGTFKLDDCWVSNFPGLFLDVTPFRFNEVDR